MKAQITLSLLTLAAMMVQAAPVIWTTAFSPISVPQYSDSYGRPDLDSMHQGSLSELDTAWNKLANYDMVSGAPISTVQPNAQLNESRRKNPLGLTVTTGFTKDKRMTPPNDYASQAARNEVFRFGSPDTDELGADISDTNAGYADASAPFHAGENQNAHKGKVPNYIPSTRQSGPLIIDSPSDYVASPVSLNDAEQIELALKDV
ncbi:hypothetical protein H4R33_004603 [Dimargaris cristalligena]|uniref:Uncharacterized protein n=1 Tax=Dimargaris cristalligena TaxID=215637 RepID=A0A4P9ZPP8_9FUNG|nr:hypothetical protein H4R33_004603 [Dimargaris cristalligena]RKP35297.1 hypothetical protein BJ085DRAFT_41633 [Dimargaris cristalligena]|eukprot:RKP35297.1 hypothetical protein BJ085DRAFT_41633 [Dimargaris cristalligena]